MQEKHNVYTYVREVNLLDGKIGFKRKTKNNFNPIIYKKNFDASNSKTKMSLGNFLQAINFMINLIFIRLC